MKLADQVPLCTTFSEVFDSKRECECKNDTCSGKVAWRWRWRGGGGVQNPNWLHVCNACHRDMLEQTLEDLKFDKD